MSTSTRSASRTPSVLLGAAAVAVGFAAADTYVVVLALPDMMASTGLSAEQLQRAAPIVSGFLLGYVAMLPLIGRIADLRGRTPVLVASLLVFAFGSVVTAAAYDLPSLVVGRFFQGVGGGGLVPVTLALVADIYPADRRAVPLGVVGAVQELGSVLGPLFGAVVLAVGDWRDIFWINVAVGLVLAAAIARLATEVPEVAAPPPESDVHLARKRFDVLGALLAVAAFAVGLLVMRQPDALVTSVQWGGPFVPFGSATSPWVSPIGVVTALLVVLLVARLWWARAPLFDLRGWVATARQADLLGALLLAIALGGVILAFASADPEVAVFSPAGPWLLAVSAVFVVLFVLHLRRAAVPLIPRDAFVARAAWGSLVVSFLVGSALIAALVDIPVFARITEYEDSQVKSALVLVEFLVALPVGAVVGGYLSRRFGAALLTAVGMGVAALGFLAMSTWDADTIPSVEASVVLLLTGFGFGLVLAPINAALLGNTPAASHGVSSAMLVVARMVGMLVGISALTTVGLRRYYALAADFPDPVTVCGGRTRCDAYEELILDAGIAQLHAIFLGAAGCAVAAGIAAILLLRGAAARRDAPLLAGLG